MEKVYGPPTSCQELNQLGHTLSGMYLVNGGKRQLEKILAVYCNFNELQSNMSYTYILLVSHYKIYIYENDLYRF